MVTIVDRNTVRVTFDVPESDFEAVAAKSQVSIGVLATKKSLSGVIARRAPAADPDTRTVHVEVDLDNSDQSIPVNTTAEVSIRVGVPQPAAGVPLTAASISGTKASVFVVEDGVAHKRRFDVLGEQGNTVYLDVTLRPGSRVVTEGRAVLADGDRVAAKDAPAGGPSIGEETSPGAAAGNEGTP